MDTPQAKRGKLHDFELVHQFAPHMLGGQPKEVSNLVSLSNGAFLSCSVDEVKVWELSADGLTVHVRGALEHCKPFTRGYTAVAVPPGVVHCLPTGGAVVAGVASLSQPNQTIMFCDPNGRKVLDVNVPGVSGIVSLGVTDSGTVLVGGLRGVAQELSFQDTTPREGRCVHNMPGHEGEVHVFGDLPRGLVACGSAGLKLISEGKTDACLRVWRAGKMLEHITDHDENVRCFASCGGVSAAGHASSEQTPVFVTGSGDSSWVARTATGQPVQGNSLPLNWNNERASILSVACLGTGAGLQFVTGDDDTPGRMVVWDGRGGLLQSISHPRDVCGLAVHPSSGRSGVGGGGGGGGGVAGQGECSAFILSACRDGFVRVWTRATDIAASGAVLAETRATFAAAVSAAVELRARNQRLQAGGSDANAGAAGTVEGVQYDHTMSIALDGAEPGQPPIRVGFNQVDFFKDVAAQIASRHGLDHNNTSQLEKAIRAQQEQAAGPPRSLGPPGELERPPRIAQRRYSRICSRVVQRSGGGFHELAKKFQNVNQGLRTRERPGALDDAQVERVLSGISLLSKKHEYHRTGLDTDVLARAVNMLVEWPPKTLFVPFGILRLAALHPSGIAWLSSSSNSCSLDALLERTSTILRQDPTPLVAASAMLFLVNVFATQDAERAAHLTAQVATTRGSAAARSIVAHVLAGTPNADAANHCWSMCINLTLMLERSLPGAKAEASPELAAQRRVAVASARAAASAVIQPVMQHAAAVGAAGQPNRRLQAYQVLCNVAASGIIDRQAFEFWESLAAALQPDGAGGQGPFSGDAVAQEEAECLLRYREPVFEAW